MDVTSLLHWGSPIGLGLFFAGAGIGCWGLFTGLAAMARTKEFSDSPTDRRHAPRER